jgi:hypothetical protein
MDVAALLRRLERLPDTLEALLAGLPLADWRWRPADGAWSILEIVGHLLAEEVDDFRARARLTLEDPARDWPRLDPEGAVKTGRFQDRDPAETLRELRRERERSLAWLRSVAAGPWENVHVTPKPPPLAAGDLLASWAAHDARHVEQIAKRLHGLAARDGAPYSVGYAG